jgi:hypothetical protein
VTGGGGGSWGGGGVVVLQSLFVQAMEKVSRFTVSGRAESTESEGEGF